MFETETMPVLRFTAAQLAALGFTPATLASTVREVRLEFQGPGEDLGALLAGTDPAGLDSYDLVSYLAACERQTAWVQWRQLLAVRELAGRRLVPGRGGEPADSPLPDGAVNDQAGDEVAAALCLPRVTGAKRVWLAGALARLPRTEAAFATGQLSLTKTWAIAEELSVLDDQAATAAEARVLTRAPDQTLGNLRRALARAVAGADPGLAARKAATAHTERRVILTPQPHGMCEFWALLPAADAMTLWAAITALADQARAADRADLSGSDEHRSGAHAPETEGSDEGAAEPGIRSMDQARADVLADLARAVLDRADLPTSHRRRPHIQITLSALTALGLDDQPGELAGYGPIPAAAARRIAADGTWRRLLTDPATGGLLDYGRTTYQPPQNLAEHVISRDQTCRGLGCRIPAERCDLDHTISYPDGPTAAHNLSCLCRACHRRKHQAGWALRLDPNGDTHWTSPTGHTYHDPAPPILDTAPPPTTDPDTPPF